MMRRPPRSTLDRSSAASDVYKRQVYDVFNLGTGTGNTVLEAVNTFEQENGVKVPYVIGPRRPGDVVAMYADTTKSRKVLGWQTELTLADALRDAWRWQQTLAETAGQ